MQNANIYAAFVEQTERRPDAAALTLADQTISYAELRTLVGQFASLLLTHGAAPGERIVCQVEKSAGTVALYFACIQVGAVFVPLNIAYTDAEVGAFLDDADPVLFVHDPARQPLWPKALALGSDAKSPAWAAGLAHEPTFDVALREPADIAALCYTSGTTGRSKGAMITHGNLLSNVSTLNALWQFTPEDRLLHILPIYHVHGLFVALHCALLSGAEIFFEHAFDLDRVMALLPKATVLMGVPTHYTRLLADPRLDRAEVAGMRLFLCGSAPLPAPVHDAFAVRTGARILERYGMTEAGMITSNPYDGDRIAGTVGFPLDGVEVRVRNDPGAIVSDGSVGTLEIMGPNVFAGYWRMPEQTAASFTADGWFITGDLATIAGDGRVTIVGRAKDMIIAGGLNIYPKEVETVIDAMPGVSESAVIGIPHPDFGEAVVAVIVTHPDAVINDAMLHDWLEPRLARFKHPRTLNFVDALPRNAMGKVQKQLLRERYGATAT